MITAHRHQLAADPGKEQSLMALFPAVRETLANLSSMTVKELRGGLPLARWRILTDLPFDTDLSARQVKSAQNQVHAVFLAGPARGRRPGNDQGLRPVRCSAHHLARDQFAPRLVATELVLPWRQTSDKELAHVTHARAQAHPGTACGWRWTGPI